MPCSETTLNNLIYVVKLIGNNSKAFNNCYCIAVHVIIQRTNMCQEQYFTRN